MKKQSKNAIDAAFLGTPLGDTAPQHTFLEALFRDNISIADTMPLS